MSQTETAPVLFCSTMSVVPSLLKSPVPTTCHVGPGLATSADLTIWPAPFTSQTATSPVFLCNRMSVPPSP